MAVYTEISLVDAAPIVLRLGLGEPLSLQGIESGIENTNYFIETTAGRFVLTLFERLSFSQLPYYLRLMQHLAQRGLVGQLQRHLALSVVRRAGARTEDRCCRRGAAPALRQARRRGGPAARPQQPRPRRRPLRERRPRAGANASGRR